MKIAIEILKKEIAQRELALKSKNLNKDDIQTELFSLYKAVNKLIEIENIDED